MRSGVSKILFLLAFCSCCYAQLTLLTQVAFQVGSQAPSVRPQARVNPDGVIFNSRGFFKTNSDLLTIVNNVTETSGVPFLATAVQYSSGITYAIYFNNNTKNLLVQKWDYQNNNIWSNNVDISQFVSQTACLASDTVAQTVDNVGSLLFAQYCNGTGSYMFRMITIGTIDSVYRFPYELGFGAVGVPLSGSQVFVTGILKQSINATLAYGSPFLAKLFANLTIEWIVGLPLSTTSSLEYTYGMVVQSSAVFIGGVVHSGITGFTTGANATNSDAYIAKYSYTGSLVNATVIATPQDDVLYDLTMDAQGNIFACGWTKGNFSSATDSSTNYRMFVARMLPTLQRNLTLLEPSVSSTNTLVPGVSCSYNINTGIIYTVMRYSSSDYLRSRYIDSYFTTPTPSMTPSRTPTPSITPSKSPSATPSPVSPSPSPSQLPPSMTPSTSPSPFTTPSSSVTPAASSSPSETPTNDSSSSDASKKSNMIPIVAGAVGGAALLAVMAVAFACFAVKRRKGGNNNNSKPQDIPMMEAAHQSTKGTTSLEQYFEIPYEELAIEAEIGRGAFGIVFKARWRNSPCVVKQLNLSDATSKEEFLKEATNVRKLRSHPNVCTVFGVCSDPRYPTSIVMEFVEGGSLKDLVYDEGVVLDKLTVIRIVKDVAGGMSHIHKEGLLHCDLACRNLLYQQMKNRYLVKVTDLGLARISESGHYSASETAKFPIRWSAPEVLTKRQLSRASDVWSFGVVIYEILEGKLPYYLLQNSEVPKFVCNGGELEAPTHLDFPELWNLATRCMEREASKRPSFDELFQEIEDLEAQFDTSNPYGNAKKVAVVDENSNPTTLTYHQMSTDRTTSYSTSNYNSRQ